MREHIELLWITLPIDLYWNLLVERLLHLLLGRIEVHRGWRLDICDENGLLRSWLVYWQRRGSTFRGCQALGLWIMWCSREVDNWAGTIRNQEQLTLIGRRWQPDHRLSTLQYSALIS